MARAEFPLDGTADDFFTNEADWGTTTSLIDEVDNPDPTLKDDLFSLNDNSDMTWLADNPSLCLDGNPPSRRLRRGVDFCSDPTTLDESALDLPVVVTTQEEVNEKYCPASSFPGILKIPVCSEDDTLIRPSDRIGPDQTSAWQTGLKNIMYSTLSTFFFFSFPICHSSPSMSPSSPRETSTSGCEINEQIQSLPTV